MKRYFHEEAVGEIREAVRQAGGNEVFFLGKVGSDGRVARVDVIARGNQGAVPAVFRSVRAGEAVIHNHPGGNLTPSSADLDLAARFGDMGVGFFIVDNEAENVYVVIEPFREKEVEKLDLPELEAMFQPGAPMASGFAHYEHRAEQVRMAAFLAGAFNEERIAIVEAGTGVGKSLAYLVPAVLWAKKNSERVIVSTHTINLQEQLYFKDLPTLKEAIGIDFSFSLLKGRSQYACRRKIDYLSQEGQPMLKMDELGELTNLVEWGLNTKDGSRSDLPFAVSEENWEQVSAEETECQRLACPFYGNCFYFVAKREAAQADILVVNHHLLMADVSLRSLTGRYTEAAVLPPFQRVVVDEGHSLEDAATSYFGLTVSRHGLLKVLGRLQGAKKKDKGLLPFLVTKIHELSFEPQWGHERAARFIVEKLQPTHDETLRQLESCLERILMAMRGGPGSADAVPGELKIRVTPDLEAREIWREHIEPEIVSLKETSRKFAAQLFDLLELFGESDSARNSKLAIPLLELRSKAKRLEETASSLDLFLKGDPEYCRWIEAMERRRGPIVRIRVAPIDIGKEMKSAFFDKFKTIALTSATLTSGGTFSFLKRRTGLEKVEPQKLEELVLHSPFDYGRQVFFGVPLDIPEPGEPGFEQALSDLVLEAVSISGGRAFVLFTSFAMLRKIFDRTSPELSRQGYPCMRQGLSSRKRLLERFRNEAPAVLFGTDSFWEGVDVKGRALECVMLTRLPFRVPSEPIQQARAERILKEGGDPFLEYSLPQAVIRLRQGFGRLIRSRQDRGAVLIFDKRFKTRGYGQEFERSLPECEIRVGPRAAVFSGMQGFFQLPT